MGYINLKAEMARKAFTARDLAALLKIHHNSALGKLNEKRPFTVEEALTVHKEWFPEQDMSYLFRREQEEKSEERRIKIGNAEYSEILICDQEGNLLVSITDEDIIEAKDCTVTCVPFSG